MTIKHVTIPADLIKTMAEDGRKDIREDETCRDEVDLSTLERMVDTANILLNHPANKGFRKLGREVLHQAELSQNYLAPFYTELDKRLKRFKRLSQQTAKLREEKCSANED